MAATVSRTAPNDKHTLAINVHPERARSKAAVQESDSLPLPLGLMRHVGRKEIDFNFLFDALI